MTPKKGRGIGAYLLVVVVLIVALVFLLNGLKTGGKETKYSDIMKYFDNYEVTAYTLDLGSGELKLTLDDGAGERTVASGIAKWYTEEELVGKKVIVVANLKPAKLRGVESNGMLLAADTADGGASVVFVDGGVHNGSKIH